MQRLQLPILLVLASSIAFPVHADGGFAGEWRMVSHTVDVDIDSWGEGCGVRPSSKRSNIVRPVIIFEEGGHLKMSEGQIRTDRCGSPNPKMKSVIARRSDSRWKRQCRTPKSEPKQESGDYTLVAVNDNRLEYTAESHFQWHLGNERCSARIVDTRVFIRENPTQPNDPSANIVPSPSSSLPSDHNVNASQPSADNQPMSVTVDECAQIGPLAEIALSPKRATVGPGEKLCFTAIPKDKNGCEVKGKPSLTWTVEQNEIPIEGLVTKTGCFVAGETAAEAEGRYLINARAEGKVGSAEISVVFADLGDLLSARLKPMEDKTQGTPQAPEIPSERASSPIAKVATSHLNTTVHNGLQTNTTANSGPIAQTSKYSKNTTSSTPPVMPQKNTKWTDFSLIIGIIVIIGFLGVGVGVVYRIRRHRAASNAPDTVETGGYDEEDDWPDNAFSPIEIGDEAKEEDATDPTESLFRCPVCDRIFYKNVKMCPFDNTAVIQMNDPVKINAEGMICPKCHRGYEADARYCPHDSERLIPYAIWRISKKPISQ